VLLVIPRISGHSTRTWYKVLRAQGTSLPKRNPIQLQESPQVSTRLYGSLQDPKSPKEPSRVSTALYQLKEPQEPTRSQLILMRTHSKTPRLDPTRFYNPISLQEVTDWVTARYAEGKITAHSEINRRVLKRHQSDLLARDRSIAVGDLAPKEQAIDSLRNLIRTGLYDPNTSCLSITVHIPLDSLKRISDSRPLTSELVSNLSLLDARFKRSNENFIYAWNVAWSKFFGKLERRISVRSAPTIRLKYVRIYEHSTSDPSRLTHAHLIVQVPRGFSSQDFARSFARAFDHFVYPLPPDPTSITGFNLDPSPTRRIGRPLVLKETRWNALDCPQFLYDTKQLTESNWLDRVECRFGEVEKTINK